MRLPKPRGPVLSVTVILIACMLLGAFAYNVFVAEPARRAAAAAADTAQAQQKVNADWEQKYVVLKAEGKKTMASYVARTLADGYAEQKDLANYEKWKAIAEAEAPNGSKALGPHPGAKTP